MARDDASVSAEERAALMLLEDLKTFPKMVNDMSGTPYGVRYLTPDQELWSFGYEDTSIDIDGLRAQGKKDVEIGELRYPLRRHLMEQGGVTEQEQHRHLDRIGERYLKAQAAGRILKPPPRDAGV